MFQSWWRLMLSISMVMNARSTPLRLSNSVCLRALHADCSQHDVPECYGHAALHMQAACGQLCPQAKGPGQQVTYLTIDVSLGGFQGKRTCEESLSSPSCCLGS